MQSTNNYRLHAGISAVLIAIVWIVYGQSCRFEFVDFDDDRYILESPTVRGGVTAENTHWAWTHSYFSNWHPVTTMSWMLDVEFYGLDAGGMHLSNVLWHSANVLLLFGVLRTMTGAIWRSAMAAAFFAIHPIHVESVAWISSRKDLLFMFFALLALWFYVLYVQRQDRRCYAVSLLFYGCSLLSKQMLVTFPFVLLLVDFWPLRRMQGRHADLSKIDADAANSALVAPSAIKSLLLEKLPYFGVAAAFAVMIFIIQNQHGSVSSLETLPLTTRLMSIPPAYAEYLLHAAYPVHLAVLYPFAERSPAVVLLTAAALIALSVTILRQARNRPYLICGWCWFLGTLVPVIGLVQVGAQRLADRYSYFPMIGIYVMVVWFFTDELVLRRSHRKTAVGLSAGLLLLAGLLAFRQVGVWRDSVRLYRHTLACTTDNLTILGNLGLVLDELGRTEESMDCFLQALRIDPDRAETHSHLGQAYHRKGDDEKAAEHIARSLQLGPADAKIQYNAGTFLQDLQQREQALTCYGRAIDLSARNDLTMRALNNSGIICFESGRPAEARRYFERALAMNADRVLTAEAFTNLGILDAAGGSFAEAQEQLQQALTLNPDDAHAHFYLGRVLLGMGKKSAAEESLHTAVKLDSQFQAAVQSLLATPVDPGKTAD